MNDINYNFKRHVELLNQEKKLRSEGKFFFAESENEFKELCQYNSLMSQHIFWENRFEVSSLIQTFLNKKINAYQFHDSVFGLRRNHLAKCKEFQSKLTSEEIKEFFPNQESYKLKGFLSFLYFECEHFEMKWDEEDFYNTILDGFLKFQKILEEE